MFFSRIQATVLGRIIARSALYVRGIVKIGCSVCSSVRSSVRPSVRDFQDFYQKNLRGSQMPLNLEVLKHRFQKFLQKPKQSRHPAVFTDGYQKYAKTYGSEASGKNLPFSSLSEDLKKKEEEKE